MRRVEMHQSHITRRELLLGAAAMIPVVRSHSMFGAAGRRFFTFDDAIADIERRIGGRLGVAVLDTSNATRIDYRQDERFAMCSTFKLLAVAATLKLVDEKKERIDRRVAYDEKDLLGYAPITKQYVNEGAMTLSALCAAAIEYSDNTAGNLLLRELGGPAAVTRYARSIGDGTTRLDRNEPTVNTALPGDARDTTTPAAMVAGMKALLLDDAISETSRQQLIAWLEASTTGNARLRAGVPEAWRVGDKTGTGDHGATGDIAIMWPPSRQPILAAMYLTETAASLAERNAAFAEVGRMIAATVFAAR
jgi:beta-lactamase class A